jgi:hypothetical protein
VCVCVCVIGRVKCAGIWAKMNAGMTKAGRRKGNARKKGLGFRVLGTVLSVPDGLIETSVSELFIVPAAHDRVTTGMHTVAHVSLCV